MVTVNVVDFNSRKLRVKPKLDKLLRVKVSNFVDCQANLSLIQDMGSFLIRKSVKLLDHWKVTIFEQGK